MDALCSSLADAVSGTVMGNGLDEEVEQGPIQNKMQFDKVCGLLDDAKANGARILCGGAVPDPPRLFHAVHAGGGRDRWECESSMKNSSGRYCRSSSIPISTTR